MRSDQERSRMFNDWLPIDWEQFHFIRPLILWALLPVLCFFIIGLLSIRQEVKWKSIIAPHLRPFVIQKGNLTVKVWMNFILLLVFLFGIISAAGPTWKRMEVSGRNLETPVVILLDLSQSMMTEDLQPNRLERAKFKIKDLLDFNPHARVALVGFAGTAHTIVPLTKDYKIISSHVEGLKPSVMPFAGSDLSLGLTLADSVMSITDAPGTVVIFADDFESSNTELFGQFVSQTNHTIEIVPMGTITGGEVPSRRGKKVMKDKKGQPVYSALNQQSLNRLGALEGVTLHSLTLDKSDMEVISKKISANLTFTEDPKEKNDEWRDAGLLFVFPMALLILFWFRKGWVIYVTIILFSSSCEKVNSFQDLWYSQDFQGQKLSNQGAYDQAAEKYENPMRKGVAYFKSGDFESAIKAFNEDTTAQGVYNLGLAYFSNGDTLAAQLAFAKAIELDPSNSSALKNQQKIEQIVGGTSKINPSEAQEATESGVAKNEQNKDMEDLSGGGQEATKEDMEKERKEETVSTDVRLGKELDEVPEDIENDGPRTDQSKVLMRKVDDDPMLFLKRKFEYQVKQKNLKPNPDADKW
ncbi:VWA domain-containing protein [Reichenbachiella sp.]|uniref:VWA domain-containing protein n=1 Tax=Reichenbachiella sp. TaxID=2184521 RepID=UPI003B5A7AB7